MSRLSRSTSWPPSGGPSYSPDNLPVYRGGSSGANVAPFDPNTLFAASDYGDFMRVSDSAVQSSGGLLTRWPGLRSAGSTGARFDVMPYSSAPSVGAYGPNGEQAIRMAVGGYTSGSNDRGGSGSLEIPTPYKTETSRGTGFIVAVRAKFTGTVTTFWPHIIDFNTAEFNANNSTIEFHENSVTPVINTANTATVTNWNTYAIRVKKDGTVSLYINSGSTPVSTVSSPDAAVTLFRWNFYLYQGTGSADISAYVQGHIEPSDADFASLMTWMEG